MLPKDNPIARHRYVDMIVVETEKSDDLIPVELFGEFDPFAERW